MASRGLKSLDPIQFCRCGSSISYITRGGNLPGGNRPCGGYGFFFCDRCHALYDDEGIPVTDFPVSEIPASFLYRSVGEVIVEEIEILAKKLLPVRIELDSWGRVSRGG